MKGVVLCGGLSTRLPVKLFLCNRQGVPLVVAAAQTLVESGMLPRDVVFCCNKYDRVLIDMIGACGFKDASFVLDDHRGLTILNAVKDDKLVLCGDNAYGGKTVSLIRDNRESTRAWAAVNYEVRGMYELDMWDSGKSRWVLRAAVPEGERYKPLTTPWYLPKDIEVLRTGIIGTLNYALAAPVNSYDHEWADLGTMESAKAYYGKL